MGPDGPFSYCKRLAAEGEESSGPAFKPQTYHSRSARVTVRGGKHTRWPWASVKDAIVLLLDDDDLPQTFSSPDFISKMRMKIECLYT